MSRVTEVALAVILVLALSLVGVVGEFALTSPSYVQDAYQAVPLLVSRLGVLVVVCTLGTFLGVRRKLPALLGSVWCLILLLMTGAVNGGLAVKAHLKGFNQMAQAWLATASENERLAVFKHPFDEYFDPLLYYVHRPVTILPLEAVGTECEPHTVYVAKSAWLNAHQGVFKGNVVRVFTARERLLAEKDDSSRDLVFFRCDTYGIPTGQFESSLMQDAAYQGGGITSRIDSVQ
jgi:hypothetical protein